MARPGLFARRGQHLEAQLLVSLETVGAGSRLECAAAQAGCSHGLELACQLHDLLFTLDRAWPGDHGHTRATDFEPARFHHGPFVLQLRRRSLVRSHDGQDFFNPFTRFKDFRQPRPFFAERRDDGLVRAVNDLGR